jgi:hypothetical protein
MRLKEIYLSGVFGWGWDPALLMDPVFRIGPVHLRFADGLWKVQVIFERHTGSFERFATQGEARERFAFHQGCIRPDGAVWWYITLMDPDGYSQTATNPRYLDLRELGGELGDLPLEQQARVEGMADYLMGLAAAKRSARPNGSFD